MKGSYKVRIGNARLQYKFELRRNITIVRGKSATGKSTLIGMVAEYAANGPASGITLSSAKPCVVIDGVHWRRELEEIRDSFVFIDEGNEFVRTHEFARAVRDSSNYYVLATREHLPSLPYSVDEVYVIKNDTRTKYPPVERLYSSFKSMYGDRDLSMRPQRVIVEDANSCYEFFRALCGKSGIECVSAGGKAKIVNLLKRDAGEGTLVVADGAAFGPEMEVVSEIARRKNAMLFLPESFEWLLLASGLVPDADIPAILQNPASYIESRDYFSWERFFTELLRNRTAASYLKYEKRKLNNYYLEDSSVKAICRNIPSELVGD